MSRNRESKPSSIDLYALAPESVRDPPRNFKERLRFLGPSLILVGGIVGSGEIILTTSLGALVGFSMLWFVLLSCWSKNIIQSELARYSVSTGEPFLHAFNRLPGKIRAFRGKRVSWYIYFWLLLIIPGVFLAGGGIYGGAGQVIHAAIPAIGSEWWTVGLAVLSSVIICTGSYKGIERLLTVMVLSFTIVTLICAVLLQTTEYAITWDQVQGGLTFSFPVFAILVALGMYSATGVGTADQIFYTYWCVEKGYARFTGPVNDSKDWVKRARGWIKVMHLDVILSLILLTFATIPFYMLGAGILHQLGQQPDGLETISVISSIYTRILGGWAFWLFMAGAFIVLFSTCISGLGGGARTFADGLAVLGLMERNDYTLRIQVLRGYAVVTPLGQALSYYIFQNPVWMLTVGMAIGVIQFPIIAAGTIYLRYKFLDKRIAPSRLTNIALWMSFFIMLGLAIWILYLSYTVKNTA